MADRRESELFEAAFAGDGRRVANLLALGASPAARDTDGSTVLCQAVGHAWVVGLLLAAGAPPDPLSGGDGEGTALCRAACFGHRDSVETLLAGGADPNAAARDGYTPLLWAVGNGRDECAQVLLEAGADPNLARTGGLPLISRRNGWARTSRPSFAVMSRATPATAASSTRHTVDVHAHHPDGSGVGHEMECGHREIVELLQPEP